MSFRFGQEKGLLYFTEKYRGTKLTHFERNEATQNANCLESETIGLIRSLNMKVAKKTEKL